MVKTSKVVRLLLAKHNKPKFNITKTVEELNEASTVLLQRINKGDGVLDEKIVEELAHARIRLDYMIKVFGKDKVQAEIDKKEKHLIKKYK
tara:strand:- start:63438 stop:63710 length:273 start_codon:yes stop_codon:yes gene_type:complete